jgi:hypothetical protein
MRGPIFWPLLLIAVGVMFLLINFGVLPANTWDVIWRFWPVILIVIGLDIIWRWARRSNAPVQTEALSFDLGGLTEAEVKIEFGAGQLHVGACDTPGKLAEGEFSGGVQYRLHGDDLKLKMPEDSWMWERATDRRWEVRLTRAIPLHVRVRTGASRVELDLTELRVTDLRVGAGAAESIIHLSRAAGQTRAHVETGAAATVIHVPEGVAARIRANMALGTVRIDSARFPQTGNEYCSPDYATAPNKLDLQLEGGVGEVVVQ